jgi:hypothetical protein
MQITITVLRVLDERAHFALSPDACAFYAWYKFREWRFDAWDKTEALAIAGVKRKVQDYFKSEGIIEIKEVECQL